MIRDFILSLVAMFVVEPLQAEFTQRLQAVQAPQAIVRDLATCAQTAAPAIADRVIADWGWGATTAFGLVIGTRTPEAVAAEITPTCGPAVRAARLALTSAGA